MSSLLMLGKFGVLNAFRGLPISNKNDKVRAGAYWSDLEWQRQWCDVDLTESPIRWLHRLCNSFFASSTFMRSTCAAVACPAGFSLQTTLRRTRGGVVKASHMRINVMFVVFPAPKIPASAREDRPVAKHLQMATVEMRCPASCVASCRSCLQKGLKAIMEQFWVTNSSSRRNKLAVRAS